MMGPQGPHLLVRHRGDPGSRGRGVRAFRPMHPPGSPQLRNAGRDDPGGYRARAVPDAFNGSRRMILFSSPGRTISPLVSRPPGHDYKSPGGGTVTKAGDARGLKAEALQAVQRAGAGQEGWRRAEPASSRCTQLPAPRPLCFPRASAFAWLPLTMQKTRPGETLLKSSQEADSRQRSRWADTRTQLWALMTGRRREAGIMVSQLTGHRRGDRLHPSSQLRCRCRQLGSLSTQSSPASRTRLLQDSLCSGVLRGPGSYSDPQGQEGASSLPEAQ